MAVAPLGSITNTYAHYVCGDADGSWYEAGNWERQWSELWGCPCYYNVETGEMVWTLSETGAEVRRGGSSWVLPSDAACPDQAIGHHAPLAVEEDSSEEQPWDWEQHWSEQFNCSLYYDTKTKDIRFSPSDRGPPSLEEVAREVFGASAEPASDLGVEHSADTGAAESGPTEELEAPAPVAAAAAALAGAAAVAGTAAVVQEVTAPDAAVAADVAAGAAEVEVQSWQGCSSKPEVADTAAAAAARAAAAPAAAAVAAAIAAAIAVVFAAAPVAATASAEEPAEAVSEARNADSTQSQQGPAPKPEAPEDATLPRQDKSTLQRPPEDEPTEELNAPASTAEAAASMGAAAFFGTAATSEEVTAADAVTTLTAEVEVQSWQACDPKPEVAAAAVAAANAAVVAAAPASAVAAAANVSAMATANAEATVENVAAVAAEEPAEADPQVRKTESAQSQQGPAPEAEAPEDATFVAQDASAPQRPFEDEVAETPQAVTAPDVAASEDTKSQQEVSEIAVADTAKGQVLVPVEEAVEAVRSASGGGLQQGAEACVPHEVMQRFGAELERRKKDCERLRKVVMELAQKDKEMEARAMKVNRIMEELRQHADARVEKVTQDMEELRLQHSAELAELRAEIRRFRHRNAELRQGSGAGGKVSSPRKIISSIPRPLVNSSPRVPKRNGSLPRKGTVTTLISSFSSVATAATKVLGVPSEVPSQPVGGRPSMRRSTGGEAGRSNGW